VIITGTNLFNVAAVTFNGTAASGFTVNMAGTQITATVPTGATSGLIGVAAKGGAAVSSTGFTVTAAPSPLVSHFVLVPGLANSNGTASGGNTFSVGPTTTPSASLSIANEHTSLEAIDGFFADEPLFHPGIWVGGV
jgi:hypothetical protein